jgi:hypothetical protein
VSVRKNLKTNVLNRVAANRRRVEEARQREEREAEAIRKLTAKSDHSVFIMEQVQPEPDDIVGQCVASILRVTKLQ